MVPIALKNSQPNWRNFIRPMLLISLGLHGLLLFLPTSSAPKPEAPAEEKVNLTSLPTESSAARPSVRPAATPSPRVAVSPPRSSIAPLPPRVNPLPVIRSQVAPRPVTQAAAQSTPAPSAATPAPSNAASTPSNAAQTTTPSTLSPLPDPFTTGFPRYANAQPGSFGLPSQFDAVSQKTSDSIEQVASFYQQALPAAQYDIAPVEQAGRTVFQVAKAGQSRYLTLIAGSGGTSIVLSDQLLPDDLGSGAIQDPALSALFGDIGVFLGGEGWQDVSELVDPIDQLLPTFADFFTTAGETGADGFYIPPEVRTGITQARVNDADPQTVFANLDALLATGQIVTQQTGSYGGGTLYEVSRTDQATPPKTVTVYLVLVPTTDNRTILFLWDRAPQ